MRNIPYIKKETTAKTIYCKVTSTDLKWILDQSKRLVDVASSNIEEGASLNAPNPKLPRKSTGTRNSPKSLCDGVLDNFNKSQYDLSSKQMDGLTESFRVGEQVIDDFDSIIFTEVSSLPKIISPKTLPDDLFDVDYIQTEL